MCEIAVVDPEKCGPTIIHQLAAKFEEEQGDGLGVLAIKNGEDGFEYDTYKSVHPHWQTMYAFLRRNLEDTWRFVIHGRASTCGDINRESAHPIRVDCDTCEFEHVIHNGSVRKHRNIRAGLTSQGHHFNTRVDSEVLAHKVQELPDTVQDHDRNTYTFRGNLNYLLFSENGILVRVSSKYHLTDDFVMTCSRRSFEEPDELGFERGKRNEWMLITPGEDEPEIETKERSTWGNRSRTRSGSNYRNTSQGNQSNVTWAGGSPNVNDDPDTYTKEYTDHAAGYENITAIKVAPGVLEVIDELEGQSVYIYRDADPRAYYWYAPEEPQADLDYLEELAERKPYKPGQTHLEDFSGEQDPDGEACEVEDSGNGDELPEEEVIHYPTAEVIAEEEDGVTMEEAAEIADEVYEKLQQQEDAIHGTIGD